MSGSDPTQKQIAEKYKGNLDYFRKGHYLRRWRGIVFALTVVGSIGGALTFKYWGKQDYLSTGPISENHERFANDCQVCHEGANTDLLTVLPFKKVTETIDSAKNLTVEQLATNVMSAKMPTLGKLPTVEETKASAAKLTAELSSEITPEKLMALYDKGISSASLSRIDHACLKCHQPMNLHQPQAPAIALKNVLHELPLVHAGACTTCHREHVGHDRMKLPKSQTCESCHNDAKELVRTKQTLPLPETKIKPALVAVNLDIGDGLVRFVAPAPTGPSKAFKSYADGHPDFAYKQPNLKDPAQIKYNHARHDLGDIPELNGHKLTCTDCHKPGGNGVSYQTVSYDKHCQVCHSLHIDPDMPEIRIPHGDTEKVRDFLRPGSLTLHFAESLRKQGVTDRMEVGKRLKEQFDALSARGMSTAEELERRVFFVGDPPNENERTTSKSNKATFFPACAKCHEMEKPTEPSAAPKVKPTNMAERWVQRGPFTHVPHAHMQCVDCHGAAKTSKLTTDILMPSQKICAECHRPLDKKNMELAQDTLKMRAQIMPNSSELADSQRRAGGVKWECLSCHKFHAPPAATILVNAQGK